MPAAIPGERRERQDHECIKGIKTTEELQALVEKYKRVVLYFYKLVGRRGYGGLDGKFDILARTRTVNGSKAIVFADANIDIAKQLVERYRLKTGPRAMPVIFEFQGSLEPAAGPARKDPRKGPREENGWEALTKRIDAYVAYTPRFVPEKEEGVDSLLMSQEAALKSRDVDEGGPVGNY